MSLFQKPTFIRLIIGTDLHSSFNSVTNAWIGVNDLNGALSFLSDPGRTLSPTLSFVPNWVSITDATKKCVTILASNGGWEALECKDSGNMRTTLCRLPPIDQSGYKDNGKYIKKDLYFTFIL